RRNVPGSANNKAQADTLGGSVQPGAIGGTAGGFVGPVTSIPEIAMSALSLVRPTFVPWDIEMARLNFGANCGPASFAALMKTEVCRVISYFPHFEHSNWTNLTQMLGALDGAGYDAELRRRELPSRGLALIQWLGPWT